MSEITDHAGGNASFFDQFALVTNYSRLFYSRQPAIIAWSGHAQKRVKQHTGTYCTVRLQRQSRQSSTGEFWHEERSPDCLPRPASHHVRALYWFNCTRHCSTYVFNRVVHGVLYSLRSILLFANMDVFIIKIYLDTFILAKSIIDRREYKSLPKKTFFFLVRISGARSCVLYM
jgi:hypothetical protein